MASALDTPDPREQINNPAELLSISCIMLILRIHLRIAYRASRLLSRIAWRTGGAWRIEATKKFKLNPQSSSADSRAQSKTSKNDEPELVFGIVFRFLSWPPLNIWSCLLVVVVSCVV